MNDPAFLTWHWGAGIPEWLPIPDGSVVYDRANAEAYVLYTDEDHIWQEWLVFLGSAAPSLDPSGMFSASALMFVTHTDTTSVTGIFDTSTLRGESEIDFSEWIRISPEEDVAVSVTKEFP